MSLIIESIQFNKIVARCALLIEELSAVADFIVRQEDEEKIALARLHMRTVAHRIAEISDKVGDAKQDMLTKLASHKLDEIQLERIEQMQRTAFVGASGLL